MDTKDLILLGSKTAKAGFSNEDDIVEKFNNWVEDEDAKEWLSIMGYKLEEIEKILAIKIHGFKTDVQVQISIFLKEAISAENISIKLVSNPQGFNQIDKRKVEKYIEMWTLPESIATGLKYFTGELAPNKTDVRDSRRMFLDELNEDVRNDILDFFTENKFLIVSDIIKGRGKLSAGWMMVALKIDETTKWTLKSINHALNLFGNGDVTITKQGNLRIGKITMQRKGGDGGRESAKMLQFKINPVELFKSQNT